jgi:hypothetical protein
VKIPLPLREGMSMLPFFTFDIAILFLLMELSGALTGKFDIKLSI